MYEGIYRFNSKWVRKKEKCPNSKWILRNPFSWCSNLSNGDSFLEAESEHGCEKWHFLVWNRVRIWRTGRHTPTENSQEYLPRDFNVYFTWEIVDGKEVRIFVYSSTREMWVTVYRRAHILFAVSINFRAISNSNFLLFDISNGSKIKSEIRFGTELTDPGLNSISSKWVVSEKRKKIED